MGTLLTTAFRETIPSKNVCHQGGRFRVHSPSRPMVPVKNTHGEAYARFAHRDDWADGWVSQLSDGGERFNQVDPLPPRAFGFVCRLERNVGEPGPGKTEEDNAENPLLFKKMLSTA